MTRAAFLLIFLGGAASISAQVPALSSPPAGSRFDVASVKPRGPNDDTPFRISFEPGGRFVAVNIPLTFLFPQLYPFPSGQIESRPSWPSWLGTEGFDIVAKAEGNPSRAEMLEMLRSLLRERFRLSVHYETREDDVFALMLANREGRLGGGLRPSDVDCTARAEAEREGRAVPPLPAASNGAPACRTSNWDGLLLSGGLTMDALVRNLQPHAQRPIVDRTGLTGHFEVTLKFFEGAAENRGVNDDVDFFTAVREQLGLRLLPERGPVQVLVIDHIARPTAD